MKQQQNEIWVGTADKSNDPVLQEQANVEFFELPVVESMANAKESGSESNRRDFLKYLGFGIGAATLAAACETPIRKAIPYVTKPDSIVPGIANYYASSFVDGGDYVAVLVKTREGRPIKIEGNTLSKVTRGGTSARAQASVLSLYDSNRLKFPGAIKGKGAGASVEQMSWAKLDETVMGKLKPTDNVRIVTPTVMSPTTEQVFAEFIAKYPNTKVVSYDAVSSAALLDAHQAVFNQRVVPDYRFDQADYIVSFGADFLGTWISPVEYAAQYASKRKVNPKQPSMSRHIQVESGMSYTGSNADNRILVKPSEQGAAIAALYNALSAAKGGAAISGPKLNEKAAKAINGIANEIASKAGKVLVVSGSNNPAEQQLVIAINQLLGSYGSTIDMTHVSYQRKGDDKAMAAFVNEVQGGSVQAVIFYHANPVFDTPKGNVLADNLKKVGLKISFAHSMDETTVLCDYAAPDHHWLESWGDAEPKRGHISLIQPTIAPLFDTRQAQESLLVWAASANLDKSSDQPFYTYLRSQWKAKYFAQQSAYASFQSFWDATLHDGILEVAVPVASSVAASIDTSALAGQLTQPSSAALEVNFYETIGVGAGQYANNPWLQELPDPVTRCAWGNTVAVSLEYDAAANAYKGYKGIGEENKKGLGDRVELKAGGKSVEMSAVPQFGQMKGTASVGLGGGRAVVGLAGKNIGTNVWPMVTVDNNGYVQYFNTNGADVSAPIAVEKDFACVQYHHTMGVQGMVDGKKINVDEREIGSTGFQGSLTNRSVIKQAHVKDTAKFVAENKKTRDKFQELNDKTLYPAEKYEEEFYGVGHHWGMYVDLNACTGCGSCVVACSIENNVPVVGRYEVHRHHEMTWLRIDRYYYGDVENPRVVYQPMMCQHCDAAPCENVCPVNATNHSHDGLNQMTYNRCIGTRYCANNCPYKVRRFNWLDYTAADLFVANQSPINGEEIPYYADNLTRMVLNPDVTVRSRGVIEKCSFCIQRIQEGKLVAKREGRQLADNDVRSACQTACPTGAIVFGDVNNPESEVSKLQNSELGYLVLEEVNVKPAVVYSAKLHNANEQLA